MKKVLKLIILMLQQKGIITATGFADLLEEIKKGISPYLSENWEARKKARQEKKVRRMKEAAKRREIKKQEK